MDCTARCPAVMPIPPEARSTLPWEQRDGRACARFALAHSVARVRQHPHRARRPAGMPQRGRRVSCGCVTGPHGSLTLQSWGAWFSFSLPPVVVLPTPTANQVVFIRCFLHALLCLELILKKYIKKTLKTNLCLCSPGPGPSQLHGNLLFDYFLST